MGPDLDTDGCTIVDNVERMEQKTKERGIQLKVFHTKESDRDGCDWIQREEIQKEPMYRYGCLSFIFIYLY